MRSIFAAVGGSTLVGLLQVLLGVGWGLEDALLRERYFGVGLNALVIGWVVGAAVHFLGRRRLDRAFFTAVALTLAPWSWIAAGVAVVLVILVWWREFRLPVRPLVLLGVAAHLVCPAVYFLVPVDVSPAPLQQPPMLEDPADEAPETPPDAPDVYLVVCDTLRADAILEPGVPTPHLDALRARGTWATHAVAPCHQTLPSHLSLLCGLDIEKIGMRYNLSRWPLHEQLEQWGMQPIAEIFRDEGWRTVGIASNPLLSLVDHEAGHQPFDQGFDTWCGMERELWIDGFMDWFQRYTLVGALQDALPPRALGMPFGKVPGFIIQRLLNPTDRKTRRLHFNEGERTTNVALAWTTLLQQDPRPHFFLLHYMDPHTPYIPPEPFRSELVRAEKPEGYDDLTGGQWVMRMEVRELQRAGEPFDEFEQELRYLHELYRAEVAAFDAQLGRVLTAIRNGGRPTVVLFTSDHGEAFGEHNNIEHAVTLFREEIDVPFIVAGFNGAAVPQGRRLAFAPELVDAGPTLLALAGIPQPEGVDGQDVLSPGYRPRPALSVMRGGVALRDGNEVWHGELYYPGEEDPEARLEPGSYVLERNGFYDLAEDPGEQHDLSGEVPAERMQRLERYIRQRLENDLFPEIPPRQLRERQREKLDALGYGGS